MTMKQQDERARKLLAGEELTITLEEAKDLQVGTVIYHRFNRNADGSPQRWKVNGQVKRWKRDRDRVKVPLKYGFKGSYGYLENDTLKWFCLREEDALAAGRTSTVAFG